MEKIGKVSKVLLLAVVVLLVIAVQRDYAYSAETSKTKIDRKRETIQKGWGETLTKREFIKWGVGIENAGWLTSDGVEREEPELKMYVDPEIEKASRRLGINWKFLFIFYKNKFCAVQLDGVTFKNYAEMLKSSYGAPTHTERLRPPYSDRRGLVWQIGNVEIFLLEDSPWSQGFYSYLPIAKGLFGR